MEKGKYTEEEWWTIKMWDHCHERLNDEAVKNDIELLHQHENVKKGSPYSLMITGFVLGIAEYCRIMDTIENSGKQENCK